MVTFFEDNFPSVFSHAVAEDWREVDEAGGRERFISYLCHFCLVGCQSLIFQKFVGSTYLSVLQT